MVLKGSVYLCVRLVINCIQKGKDNLKVDYRKEILVIKMNTEREGKVVRTIFYRKECQMLKKWYSNKEGLF